MLRASAFQPEFGLLAAGAVSASLIGRLPFQKHPLGPVIASSYRVASRIANGLRFGTPARDPAELDAVRTILFHAPPDQADALLDFLQEAPLHWTGKSVIFCDCEAPPSAVSVFRTLGASVAALGTSAIPGRLLLYGAGPALLTARGMARDLAAKYIEIVDGSSDSFRAAVTLGSAALTPLIDRAAALLRGCGVRDSEAPALAAALFQQTAKEYAHSGRQSWQWHMHEPRASDLEAQIDAAGRFGPVMRELILLGLDSFEKHRDLAAALRVADASAEQEDSRLRQQIRERGDSSRS